NAAHDAGVTALRSQLHVTADSPVPAIFDSFKRSNELVYSNGSNYGVSNEREAAKALLNKEIYNERRWEAFPEETYTQISGQFATAKAQTLFRTQAAESGEFSEEKVQSLIAPMSPAQVSSALWSDKGVVIHDRVSHQRLPVSNFNELFQAAQAFLGKQ
ncbi:MAG TPA: hypothetical protein V6D47_22120, partial [Oscillatoriaceae cyanobacterium]